MVMNYADSTALAEDAPAGLLEGKTDEELIKLLSHASRVIRLHTRRAVYATDGAGNPTNPTIQEAFRAATTAQVVMWLQYGDTQAVLSGRVNVTPVVTASSNNGASVTLDTSAADAMHARITSGGLSPEAESILGDAGLLTGLPSISYRGQVRRVR